VLLQTEPVQHADVPPAILDQARPLQLQGGPGHALATHAQHAGNALLRDQHFVADLSVQVLKQPPAQLRRQGMVPVAG
jgi:hypothetical protein